MGCRGRSLGRAGLAVLLSAAGCGAFSLPAPPTNDDGGSEFDPIDAGVGDEPPIDRASVTHEFGIDVLPPLGETEPCASWTLDNEEPLYVQAVTLS
ncbi:MAG: hypothetical protein JNK45_06965, partial [Myxococcales bacterium]|nr:hypothetical protein [Myxococcales bacterium]